MKWLARWTIRGLAGLSLLLCAATVALWVRSYLGGDRSFYGVSHFPNSWLTVNWGIETDRGDAALEWDIENPYYQFSNPNRYYGLQDWHDNVNLRPDGEKTIWRKLGFGYYRKDAVDTLPKPFLHPPDADGTVYMDNSLEDAQYLDLNSYRHLCFPLWLLFVVVAIPPLVWTKRFVVKRRYGRRIALGQCVKCGYDLRASKDRCPECGTPIALTANPGKIGAK